MRKHLRSDESGIALVTVMLVSMLACALMAGLFAALSADQRSLGFDRDQSQAYAAAHAGLEKLTTQVAQLFVTDFSPSAAQITTAAAVPPSIPGFNFVAPGGGNGYVVAFNADPCASCPNKGNPLPSPSNDITTGPFAGFKGLITPYTLTVTARSAGGGSEVRLRREIQTVAVPVFQFGIFGEKSLSFHAGQPFDFGGRVHTNEHLFLAQQTGALTFRDKLTAVGEVVRAELENTNPITSSGHTGTVTIPMVVGSTDRNLAASEGSVVGGPTSAKVGGWENLSKNTYQTNIRNTLTGAKRLDLPLVSQGAKPIDLIKRPETSDENTANAVIFGQRYFAQASLRILLSDRPGDITNLPTVTSTAPIALDGSWNPTGQPPVARADTAIPGAVTVKATSGTGTKGTGTITLQVGGVDSIPNWLRMTGFATHPAFNIGSSVVTNCQELRGLPTPQIRNCTVATATTPLNTNFNVTLASGQTITLRTGSSGSATTGNNKNINLVSTADLWWAGTRVLWSSTGKSPITCQSYDLTVYQLKDCNWDTTPPNNSVLTTNVLSAANQSLLGGFIKIERQNTAGVWTDVTEEILNLGFAAPNQEGVTCPDPTPNAVIRLQRLRDNGAEAPCGHAGSTLATDYWPQVLFDAREGNYRLQPSGSTNMSLGGVMNYVALDIANLKRWLAGTIPSTGATGNLALNQNGYIVYFSDRRGNHDPGATVANAETGEYGNEDSINVSSGAASQTPNNTRETGEDRNEDGQLQRYGESPAAAVAGVVPSGPAAPYNSASTPLTPVTNGQARVNKQVLFRRALKLINGGINGGVNNLPDSGLTIAAENGVYVQGNYNATDASVTATPNRPAAILADAITILSNNWKDVSSLNSPNDWALRTATTTGYRFAMVGGKSVAFPKPSWATAGDMGTDGGVHNFMRMLEDWGGKTIRYRGSMVSLYTARQMIGIYRADQNVYNPGTREFAFDTDFLDPTKLPPGTPMFRDVNTLRFRQILRPNQ